MYSEVTYKFIVKYKLTKLMDFLQVLTDMIDVKAGLFL